MFALLAAGRSHATNANGTRPRNKLWVQTEYQQVDKSHIVFPLTDVDTINHIIIFLTTPIPTVDLAGAVYFSSPSEDGQLCWQYLGYVDNNKPSAIFRISKMKPKNDCIGKIFTNYNSQSLVPHSQSALNTAIIGVSLEPISVVQNLTVSENSQAQLATNVTEFTSKILENLVNFTTSFAISSNEVQNRPADTYIPMNAFQKWYENIGRKLKNNPYFWKS
uniref:Hikeshi-like domain-containing protein n=1 Tax=Romanomermis culicivorax TaxID=13658 RepID=A0A915IT12_ROMCU